MVIFAAKRTMDMALPESGLPISRKNVYFLGNVALALYLLQVEPFFGFQIRFISEFQLVP
jgi:hypothetical protein